jgi:hypothetical protein
MPYQIPYERMSGCKHPEREKCERCNECGRVEVAAEKTADEERAAQI